MNQVAEVNLAALSEGFCWCCLAPLTVDVEGWAASPCGRRFRLSSSVSERVPAQDWAGLRAIVSSRDVWFVLSDGSVVVAPPAAKDGLVLVPADIVEMEFYWE